MVGICHARERRHRLTLRACGSKHDLLRRIVFELIDVDDQVIGHLDIAQLLCHLHIVDHGASREGDLSSVFDSAVDDQLDTADVGRKGRDDDTLLHSRSKQLLKAVGDLLLRLGIAGAFGVGAFGKQCQNPLITQRSKAVQVGHLALDRCIVDLEVARMDKCTGGSMQCDRDRIGDGVVDVDQLDVKAAELEGVARVLLDQGRRCRKTVLS